MRKPMAWLVGVLALCWFVADAVYATRFWDNVTPLKPPNCRTLDGLIGAEDAVVTEDEQVVLSLDARQAQAGNGRLVLMHTPDSEPIVLWDGNGLPFHPHGIDYTMEGGKAFVYVVNHLPDHDAVMVFELHAQHLTLLRQINYLGHGLNDVLAAENGQFYVTVDHLPNLAWLNRIGDYLRLPLGAIEHFDGQQFSRLATGIAFANGIAASADGKRLYVSSMLSGKVLIFDVDGRNALHQRAEIALPGKPDNLSWFGPDTLLVAVHPRILDLSKQEKWREEKAQSRILKVALQVNGGGHIEEILADDGQGISSASVALVAGQSLWVGSVFDNKVLVCDKK